MTLITRLRFYRFNKTHDLYGNFVEDHHFAFKKKRHERGRVNEREKNTK